MSYLTSFIDTCTVQRFTEGAIDGYGRPAKIWADHLTGEPCRLMVGSGREINVGAEVVIADYKLLIRDVDITEQDRVIINRITYEVLLVSPRRGGTNVHHRECVMRVVR